MTDDYNAWLGKKVKDVVSNFTGTCICIARQLSGNTQVAIQPPGEGLTMPEPMMIDVHMIDIIDDGVNARVPKPDVSGIPLGSDVTDRVSGLKGKTTAEITHINGCVTVSVQPAADKDGKLPESIAFDYKRLEVSGVGVSDKSEKPLKKRPTGGPSMKMSALRCA